MRTRTALSIVASLLLTALVPATAVASHELDDQYVCAFEADTTVLDPPLPHLNPPVFDPISSTVTMDGQSLDPAGQPSCFQNDKDGNGEHTGPFSTVFHLDGYVFGGTCASTWLYAFHEGAPANGWYAATFTTPEGTIHSFFDLYIYGTAGYIYVYKGRDGDGDRIWGTGAAKVEMDDANGNPTACVLGDVAKIRITASVALTALAENL